jgi:hypothetical protein
VKKAAFIHDALNCQQISIKPEFAIEQEKIQQTLLHQHENIKPKKKKLKHKHKSEI